MSDRGCLGVIIAMLFFVIPSSCAAFFYAITENYLKSIGGGICWGIFGWCVVVFIMVFVLKLGRR